MIGPQRGEIWFTKLPTDPPEKGKRPVVIVSVNTRNNHPRANTVLVVPLSTSITRSEVPTHIVLEPGQTGLRERSVAKAEDVATISKTLLDQSRTSADAKFHAGLRIGAESSVGNGVYTVEVSLPLRLASGGNCANC